MTNQDYQTVTDLVLREIEKLERKMFYAQTALIHLLEKSGINSEEAIQFINSELDQTYTLKGEVVINEYNIGG